MRKAIVCACLIAAMVAADAYGGILLSKTYLFSGGQRAGVRKVRAKRYGTKTKTKVRHSDDCGGNVRPPSTTTTIPVPPLNAPEPPASEGI